QTGRSPRWTGPAPAQSGEGQGRNDIEQENHRDGLGDFIVVGVDDGGGGGDGRAAADGGAHAHQGGDIGGNVHQFVQDKRDNQGGGDGSQDDGQRGGAHP